MLTVHQCAIRLPRPRWASAASGLAGNTRWDATPYARSCSRIAAAIRSARRSDDGRTSTSRAAISPETTSSNAVANVAPVPIAIVEAAGTVGRRSAKWTGASPGIIRGIANGKYAQRQTRLPVTEPKRAEAHSNTPQHVILSNVTVSRT